jgi:NAD(P)-dependent dehydrogenase (short-subunit alcohol dehydrogenase family)
MHQIGEYNEIQGPILQSWNHAVRDFGVQRPCLCGCRRRKAKGRTSYWRELRNWSQDYRGLYGLINNAGVYIGGPAIDIDLGEFQWLMNVNVFGVYRVTQAFAPMIIEEKGRILITGSTDGIVSTKYASQYSASKHAIEGFTDSLALEMAMLDVQVSVIEPGNYNSSIADTACIRLMEKEYERDDSLFADDYREWIGECSDWNRSMYKDPDEVADAALHAMSADNPLRRYLVVPDEGEADLTIGTLFKELIQLNEWQAYSYSREELISMLDEAMAGENGY